MDESRNGGFSLGHATFELPLPTSVDSQEDVGEMIWKLRELGSPYSLGVIYTEVVGDLEP